ncbi:MAG: DUF167 domain-containing protein [Hyphomicrobiaceae bacterium]|nr:DUF167 domain-containing protein [Hyphomicrobiaceae bacterium]
MTGGAPERPWRHADACVIVRFRLTPKSYKDTIDGLEATAEGPAFKARVRAVPEDGAANTALERLAAAWLDVPKSAVRLITGGKSRVKSLAINGDAHAIEGRLQERFDALKA